MPWSVFACPLSPCRQCALAALNDVRQYLSEENGHVAVSFCLETPSWGASALNSVSAGLYTAGWLQPLSSAPDFCPLAVRSALLLQWSAEFQGGDAILSNCLWFEGLAERRMTPRRKCTFSPHCCRTVLHNVPFNTSAVLLPCLFDSLGFQVEGKDLLSKKYPLGTCYWHETSLKRPGETHNKLVHTWVFNNGMQNTGSSTVDIVVETDF